MKMMLILALTVASTSIFATETRTFECYGSAVSAAKAIDGLNFPNSDQSSVLIEAVVQKSKKARISVSIGEASNRQYTVRIKKNRSAQLSGDQVSAEPGCFIESVN